MKLTYFFLILSFLLLSTNLNAKTPDYANIKDVISIVGGYNYYSGSDRYDSGYTIGLKYTYLGMSYNTLNGSARSLSVSYLTRKDNNQSESYIPIEYSIDYYFNESNSTIIPHIGVGFVYYYENKKASNPSEGYSDNTHELNYDMNINPGVAFQISEDSFLQVGSKVSFVGLLAPLFFGEDESSETQKQGLNFPILVSFMYSF